jgi:hypothetical protein
MSALGARLEDAACVCAGELTSRSISRFIFLETGVLLGDISISLLVGAAVASGVELWRTSRSEACPSPVLGISRAFVATLLLTKVCHRTELSSLEVGMGLAGRCPAVSIRSCLDEDGVWRNGAVPLGTAFSIAFAPLPRRSQIWHLQGSQQTATHNQLLFKASFHES